MASPVTHTHTWIRRPGYTYRALRTIQKRSREARQGDQQWHRDRGRERREREIGGERKDKNSSRIAYILYDFIFTLLAVGTHLKRMNDVSLLLSLSRRKATLVDLSAWPIRYDVTCQPSHLCTLQLPLNNPLYSSFPQDLINWTNITKLFSSFHSPCHIRICTIIITHLYLLRTFHFIGISILISYSPWFYTVITDTHTHFACSWYQLTET